MSLVGFAEGFGVGWDIWLCSSKRQCIGTTGGSTRRLDHNKYLSVCLHFIKEIAVSDDTVLLNLLVKYNQISTRQASSPSACSILLAGYPTSKLICNHDRS